MYSKPILITALASSLFLGVIASSYGIKPALPIKAEYQNLGLADNNFSVKKPTC